MKWVLWYLRGTNDYCITFNGCSVYVCGYVCWHFPSDLDKRRSTSRYVFTLIEGSINWMLNIQEMVTLFNTEEKYIVVLRGCKVQIFLKGFLGEFGILQNNVKVFFYSQSALHLPTNLINHSETKHMDIKHSFVR